MSKTKHDSLKHIAGKISLAEAQRTNICRICGGPVKTPTRLSYGNEFSCEACVDEKISTLDAGSSGLEQSGGVGEGAFP